MNSLAVYLGALFGAEPDSSLIELRYRLPGGGMGQSFHEVRDRDQVEAEIVERGRETDLYLGVAPRTRRAGARDAIERVHVLWADADSPEAIEALASFEPEPSIVIRSGSGRHAYWALWPPVGPDEVERANRRLAEALGADPRATDAARILRPPQTFNFKGDEPVPVEVEKIKVEVYAVGEVVGDLPDPQPLTPPRQLRSAALGADPLLATPPEIYVEVLTGAALPPRPSGD